MYFIHFTIEEILCFVRELQDEVTSRTSWQPKSQKNITSYQLSKGSPNSSSLPASEVQQIPTNISQYSETPWVDFNPNNLRERYGIIKNTISRITDCYGFIWGDITSGYNNDGKYRDIYFSSKHSQAIPSIVYTQKDAWKGRLVRYEVVQEKSLDDHNDHAPFKAINVRLAEKNDDVIPRWRGTIRADRAGYDSGDYYIVRKWAWIDINQDKEIRVDFELSPSLENVEPRNLQGKEVSFIPVANFGNGFIPEKHHPVKAVYVELV